MAGQRSRGHDHSLTLPVVALLVLWCCPVASFGQDPSPPPRSLTTVVHGQLIDSSASPVANVLVTVVSDLHRTTRQARTDAGGSFRIPAPTTTGGITVILSGGGIAERLIRASGHPLIDLGQIVVQRTPQALAPIQIRARRITPEFPGTSPGTGRAFLGPELFDDHLSELSNLDGIGALVPGLYTDETELGAARLSVPGVGAGQNSMTLDGSRYTGLIPRDAIASASVGATAEAARGRFAGAEVAARTARGGAIPQLTLRSTLYSPAGSHSVADGRTVRDPSPFTLGATVSGPLQRDNWTFFASGELGRRATGTGMLSFDAARSSGSADSVRAMIETLQLLGIPTRAVVRDGTTFATGLINLNHFRGMSSTRAVRINGFSVVGPLVPGFAFPTVATTLKHDGAQLHGEFTETVRGWLLNESRFTLSYDSRAEQSSLGLPRGDVTVSRGDGTGATIMSFGGSGLAPQRRTASSVEGASAFSWERSAHRFKLGIDARTEALVRFDAEAGSGQFSFASVSAVASNQPIGFSRSLPVIGHARHSDVNLFASHLWSVRDDLRLQTGLRWEGARLTGHGSGDRTTPEPGVTALPRISESVLLPRAAVTWGYGGRSAGRPLGEIRASVGGYRGLLPADLVRQIAADGSAYAVSCSGADVPQPRWIAGAMHDCGGSTAVLRESAILSPDLRAPTSWRGTFDISLPTRSRAALTLRGMAALTTGMPTLLDVNARGVPIFRLADEDDRPVYVQPGDIDPDAGIPDITSSRINPALGLVAEHRSDLKAKARQVTAELWVPPAVRGGGRWRASYTYTRVVEERRRTDRTDDPVMRVFVTAATERRHQLHVMATAPRNRFADINILGTIFSGAPFTPLVSSDIDGDGFSDDPAYVFAEGSADTAASSAQRSLQANGSDFVRRCISENAGRVAATNSCRGPWSGRVDIIARLRGAALRGSRRATIDVRATNVLGGLDHLLHGADALRGWSPGGLIDPVLWIPQGFDGGRRGYSYALNSNFGKIATPLNPFRISIDVRIGLGPDPQRARLLQLIGRAPGRASPATAEQLERTLSQALPNPMRLALARRDSLGLTREQVARFEAIDAAYQAEVRSVLQPLAAELAELPMAFASHDIVRRVNEAFFELQRRQMRWGDEIHDILSPSQRQRLPLYVQYVLYASDDDVEAILR